MSLKKKKKNWHNSFSFTAGILYNSEVQVWDFNTTWAGLKGWGNILLGLVIELKLREEDWKPMESNKTTPSTNKRAQ